MKLQAAVQRRGALVDGAEQMLDANLGTVQAVVKDSSKQYKRCGARQCCPKLQSSLSLIIEPVGVMIAV